MTYSVNFWGSKPRDNDDCYMGEDFKNSTDAWQVYRAPIANFSPHMDTSDIAYVEIDGPDVHAERVNPDFVPPHNDDEEWLHEIQREHLMLHGSLDA